MLTLCFKLALFSSISFTGKTKQSNFDFEKHAILNGFMFLQTFFYSIHLTKYIFRFIFQYTNNFMQFFGFETVCSHYPNEIVILLIINSLNFRHFSNVNHFIQISYISPEFLKLLLYSLFHLAGI